MENITELKNQRDALDAQINDLKTADVRKTIEELTSQIKDLSRQIVETKAEGKLVFPTITAEIADLQAKIEQLKRDRDAYSYRVYNFEAQQRNISALITEEQEKLKRLLEVD